MWKSKTMEMKGGSRVQEWAGRCLSYPCLTVPGCCLYNKALVTTENHASQISVQWKILCKYNCIWIKIKMCYSTVRFPCFLKKKNTQHFKEHQFDAGFIHILWLHAHKMLVSMAFSSGGFIRLHFSTRSCPQYDLFSILVQNATRFACLAPHFR